MTQGILTEPEALWRFDRFTLDPASGALQTDAQEIILRPKSAAVLAMLLAHGGEVVSREALLDTVWPNVTVTDDSLTQCISEIRRALGSRGGDLLRTLPRRGYQIAARVERRDRPAQVLPAPQPPHTPVAPAPVRAFDRSRAKAGVIGALLGVLGLVVAGIWLSRSLPETGSMIPPDIAKAEAATLLEAGTQVMYGPGDFVDRMRRSVVLMDRALALDPSLVVAAARASFAHANLLITDNSQDRADDLAKADRYASLAEAASPGHSIASLARAGVLRQQGRLAEALVLADRVAEDPGETSARAVAAHLRVLLGRPEEAIPALRALLVQTPNHPWYGTWRLHLGQAQLLAGEGDFGAAAFDLSPSRPGYMRVSERLCHMAAALWQGGRHEQARMILAELMARRPEVGLAWLRTQRRSDEPRFVALFEERLLAPLAAAGLRP